MIMGDDLYIGSYVPIHKIEYLEAKWPVLRPSQLPDYDYKSMINRFSGDAGRGGDGCALGLAVLEYSLAAKLR